jgi:hypothetical protein
MHAEFLLFLCHNVESISLKYNEQDAMFIYLFPKIALNVLGGFSTHHQEHKTVHTASGIVKPILLLSWMISSTRAAGSSIGLTVPEAVCTVLCS